MNNKDKAQSEIDICDKFICPTIEAAGWEGPSQIYREYAQRAGQVVVRGRKAWRDASTVLRADYALFFKTNIPLAVVEAKDNNHAMGAGMAQAINSTQLLDVPFSFASNGDGFIFRDATLPDDVLERNLTLASSRRQPLCGRATAPGRAGRATFAESPSPTRRQSRWIARSKT